MIQRTKSLISVFALLVCSLSFSQTHMKLYGEVITSDGEPASFAHVFVKDKNMGGITDIDGIFRYYISEDYYNDQLLISLVGFKPLEVPVKDLVDNPGQVLTLEENVIQLENVTVYAPEKIMRAALKNAIENNDPSQYYSKSGVVTITRQEGEKITLFEEIAFNYYYRGMKEGRALVGYEPIAQRRSIDYSAFPYKVKRGARSSSSANYFFGGSTRGMLARTEAELDSLELDITDVVEENGQKLYVVTRVREKGGLTNFYIDVEQNQLKKVELITNSNQTFTYIGGSPFNSSKYNRFRYLFTDTYHFDMIDGKLQIVTASHEMKTQYIERLTGYIYKTYNDFTNIQFFKHTPLTEQPKKYKDYFQLPISMGYNAQFWQSFEQENNHKIKEDLVASLSSKKPLEQQFEETDGSVVRGHTSTKSSFTKSDQKKQTKVNDVEVFIEQLVSNNYEADYPPELKWEDIPKLLAIANSNTVIDRFPRNILSRLYLQDCQVGIVAMWLIDSIRKNHGKRARKAWYISPMALLQDQEDRDRSKNRGGGNEYIPVNSDTKLETAYQAFNSWWENAQDISPSKSKRVNPMDGSGLNWLWR